MAKRNTGGGFSSRWWTGIWRNSAKATTSPAERAAALKKYGGYVGDYDGKTPYNPPKAP